MSAFKGEVESVFVAVDTIDEGRRGKANSVFLKQLLHVDFPYYSALSNLPVE